MILLDLQKERFLILKKCMIYSGQKEYLEAQLIQPVSGYGKGKYRFANIEMKE